MRFACRAFRKSEHAAAEDALLATVGDKAVIAVPGIRVARISSCHCRCCCHGDGGERATAATDRAHSLCVGMLRKRFEAELEQLNAARERRRREERSWRAQEEAWRQTLAEQTQRRLPSRRSDCARRLRFRSRPRRGTRGLCGHRARAAPARGARALRGLSALHQQLARACAGARTAACRSVCGVCGGRRWCKRTRCCKRKRCCAAGRAGAAGAAGRVPLFCGRRGRARPCYAGSAPVRAEGAGASAVTDTDVEKRSD